VLVILFLSACASRMPDCSEEQTVCIGLVADTNGMGDMSNRSAWQALQKAHQDGLVDRIEYIETSDAQDYAKNIRTFADLGYDILVTSGFDLGNETVTAAYEYPDIFFIAVNQSVNDFTPEGGSPPQNLAGLVFPEDQAGFLAGALAALLTKSGMIGAVCASDEINTYFRYCEGFRAGAAYIDRKVSSAIVYHNNVSLGKTTDDPEWGAATAVSLMTQGADIIFAVGGETGLGALQAANQFQTWAISIEADQGFSQFDLALQLAASVDFKLTPSLYSLIELTVEGDFPGGGDCTGLIGYTLVQDSPIEITTEIESHLEEILTALQDGSLETGVPLSKE